MGLDIRAIDDSDLYDWTLALRTGFLREPAVQDEEIEFRRAKIDLSRTQGAFDSGTGRCVATYRSFTQEITAVGGAAVTANAIANVTTSPTHRRRGLLTRMIGNDLRAAKERGDLLATLIAAEYPIYGRFGFGPATWVSDWTVEVSRTGLDPRYSGPADGGSTELVDCPTVAALGPELYERVRAVQHGAIDRDKFWWQQLTSRTPGYPWTEPFCVVHRSPEGSVDGLLVYTVQYAWEAGQPQNTATVQDLITATPAAERALWHYLLSVDWIARVETGHRAPDATLPELLPDARAARIAAYTDFLWLRPLDVPRLLEARSYPIEGSLVLGVHDPAGLTEGRYLLETGPDGASCVPTTESPDLYLDAGELGSLWLGDASAVRLTALGRIAEERSGAAARADLLLRTPRRPWCPDTF
ncbi:GNAT family N-acetyltransferase [Streptomyces palmae]|uniref:GNAT family N-acetyltransferase n=1 Tax=Streptomyces palmae TaxID=1701085 RepID=A0A4Z0GT16_9ACTN|nr:GNAT family N-acetyltransferase [Streptomyces palmae]TGB00493.1 GNAT family N-acetyltransferase [Streptomyces palmae]